MKIRLLLHIIKKVFFYIKLLDQYTCSKNHFASAMLSHCCIQRLSAYAMHNNISHTQIIKHRKCRMNEQWDRENKRQYFLITNKLCIQGIYIV